MEVIELPSGYQWSRALKRVAADPLLHVDFDEGRVRLPVRVERENIPVQCTVHGGKMQIVRLDDGPLAPVHEELIRILQVQTPLAQVAAHLEQTALSPILHELRGTPLLLDSSLYGSLMRTIIHQQLNMAFAYTLSTRFVQTYGMEKDGVWFYPEPEVTAALSVEELRELQFSRQKAEYVIGTSKRIAEGELDLHEVIRLSRAEAMKQLQHIRGIGRWTAENFLMFGGGDLDLFPVQDIGIQNAVKRLKGSEQKPSYDELEQLGAACAPFRTYAALYLWESIEG
ncbi:DNA-3-methyladenine glycosylase [Alkalicoccus chagannorensis]